MVNSTVDSQQGAIASIFPGETGVERPDSADVEIMWSEIPLGIFCFQPDA